MASILLLKYCCILPWSMLLFLSGPADSTANYLCKNIYPKKINVIESMLNKQC